MEYLQDQIDIQLPRAITHWSKKLEQHMPVDERTDVLKHLQHLFDEQISYRAEIESHAEVISIVEDVHSPSAQAHIRQDTVVAQLATDFHTTASGV